ncbi:hypothetical protein [Pseudomonas aeruginosa]
MATITHPHFGPEPVVVFAINVQQPAKPDDATHALLSPGKPACWLKLGAPEARG